ncbi:hypothetical protein D9758_006775 [Tetrapyrgos nigripes]|uniref:AAA protein C-terminal winged helix domain-containing protein n=1 Tax=Tetrapyrgos nigripes TaxID=182062 RepID=A0A8H5CVA9_9AGAR|nr:hypothetical protein D9758_006775 [Tetrapyrgos nigripes]
MSLVSRAARHLPKNFLASRHPGPLSQLRLYTEKKSAPKQTPHIPDSNHGYPHSSKPNPQVRHEVQEGTEAISYPFNPPGNGASPNVGPSSGGFKFSGNPFIDAGVTTVIGLGMVFFGGVAYIQWYKWNVLNKVELAFEPGWDPALEIASNSYKRRDHEDKATEFDVEPPWTQHLRRQEQDYIDRIVHGEEPGHYFVLLGPKGSGKGTMVYEAMASIKADGVAVCDAHPDLEVFRLRLGKALNFEFHEDSQTGLFQRRDPREGKSYYSDPGHENASPHVFIHDPDITQHAFAALNKLEKVAFRRAKKRGKPSVLIFNNVHHFNNDEDGRNMLLQLQQRAEAWAASGIMTMVFTSDDHWPFHVMRRTASKMLVLSIYDLDNNAALHACGRMRKGFRNRAGDPEEIKKVVSIVGGRLSYLYKVASARDACQMADNMLKVEKEWLLSQIGLIVDCDDDVMDEQKWSSCSWLLLQEFVKLRKEQERQEEEDIKTGKISEADACGLPLPTITYSRCRQLMTRTDFMEELDRLNIISIDSYQNVRPDSMLILHAARQVVEEEDFEERLTAVRDRIDDIESLHRTRELTFKDLNKGDKIRLEVDKEGERTV